MFGRRYIVVVIAAALLAACSSHGSQPVVPAGGAPNDGVLARTQSSTVPYGPVKFAYTGKPETYVVPEGVTSLTITAYGGKSHNNPSGVTQATIPVNPGETLAVNVGGNGGAPADEKHGGAGGYNGGAAGAQARCCFNRGAGAGSGGGGATSIQHADGKWAVIAGGAGGDSSGTSGGGGGGVAGESSGRGPYGHGGQGGTQTCDHTQIGSGTNGTSDSNSAYGGGGGGGGYCGGAGGSGSGSHGGTDEGDTGGGGGSGYFEPGATSASTATQSISGNPPYHEASVLIVPPPKLFTVISGLNNPWGAAVDAAGNVYVADTGNAVVKKNAPDGSVVKTYTGFKRPEGVAVDNGGNVYVADFTGQTVKKIAPNGTVTTMDSGKNFESVAVTGKGVVLVSDRGYSTVRSRYYWEFYAVGDSSDIYWDWEIGGNTPHELAIQSSCSDISRCPIYAQMELNHGAGKTSGGAVWAFNYDGTNSAVANINITPDAGLAYNGVTLWVASGASNAVCGLINGKCSRVGNFWQGPKGLAVTPNCTTLCTLYIVDQANGVLKKLVP